MIMSPIQKCIKNGNTKINAIWLMRQAGRYLPEFREIRKSNPDFIKLCLNHTLAHEITLQPIKRFGFDAAIIFSDILMIPYGIGQNVEFKKNPGPTLGNIELTKMFNVSKNEFTENLSPIYKLLTNLKNCKEVFITNSLFGIRPVEKIEKFNFNIGQDTYDIDKFLSKHEAPEDIELYFCGPPLMNQAVLKMADDWGIPDENVRFDDFGG